MKKKTEKDEYITFRKPNLWHSLYEKPSCFNGEVNVRKYKITVEMVDEPIAVIHKRLEKFWVESSNYHDRDPLKDMANRTGYIFKGDFRSKKKSPTTNHNRLTK